MKIRSVAKVSSVILIAILVSFLGYTFGYIQGYLGGRGDTAPIEAAGVVGILKELRAGNNETAISRLEAMLDLRLLERGVYLDSALQLAPLFSVPPPESMMAGVREYRSNHPSVSDQTEVLSVINRGLEIGHK